MDRFRILYLAAACFVYQATGQNQDTLQANEFSLDPSVFLFPLDQETTTQSSLTNSENVNNHTDKNINNEPKTEPPISGTSNVSDPMSSVADFADLFGINFGAFGNNQRTGRIPDSNVVPLDALDKALDQVSLNADQNNSLSSDPFATDFLNFLNLDSHVSESTISGENGPLSTTSGATNGGLSGTQPEVPAPPAVDSAGTATGSVGTKGTTTSESTTTPSSADSSFFDFPGFGDFGLPAENTAITNDNTGTDKLSTSQPKNTMDTTGGGAQDLLFSDNPFFPNSDTLSQTPDLPQTTPAPVNNPNQLNIGSDPSPPAQTPFSFAQMSSNPFQDMSSNPFQDMSSNPFQDMSSNPFQALPTDIPQAMPNQPQQGSGAQLNPTQASSPTRPRPSQPNFPSPSSQQDIPQPNQADRNAQRPVDQRNFLPLAENLLSQVQTLVNNMKRQREQTAMDRGQGYCENGLPPATCDPSPCILAGCVNILNVRCEPVCHECRARYYIGEREVTELCLPLPTQNTGGQPQGGPETRVRQPEAIGPLPERRPTTEVLRGMPMDSQIVPGPDGRLILVQNTNTRNFMRNPPPGSFRRIPVEIPDSRLQDILPGRFQPDGPGINIPEQRRFVMRPPGRRTGRPDPREIPFPRRGIPFLTRANPSNPPVDVLLRRGRNGSQRQITGFGRPQPRGRPPFNWPTELRGRTVSFPGEININQEQPPSTGSPQQQSVNPPQIQSSPFLSFPDSRIIESFRRGQALARQMRQFDRPTAFQPGQNRFIQNSPTRPQRSDNISPNNAQQNTNSSPVSPVTGNTSRSSQPVDPGMLSAFRRFVAAQENSPTRRRFPGSSF